MVKVCHISTVHHAGDPRIFHKECVSLAKAGFEVYLVNQDTEDKEIQGVKIKHLKSHKSRKDRFFAMFKAFSLARKTKAKIIHFHDPELMWIAVWLRIFGRKIIYDVHEDVAKQILDKKWLGPKWVRRFVSFSYQINQKICCCFFSGVVTATPEITSKFSTKKAITVHNYPILGYLDDAPNANIDKTKPSVIYAGGLTELRGIYELIEAVGELNGQLELWLLGPWESDNFHEKCKASKGYQYTKYFGKKTLQEVYTYYQLADVGAHVIQPIPRYLIGIPTKILECMAIGMPVVLTESDYWKSFFQNHSLFADPFNKQDVAQKLMDAYEQSKDPEGKQKRAEFIRKNYSWEAEEEKLINLYQKIVS